MLWETGNTGRQLFMALGTRHLWSLREYTGALVKEEFLCRQLLFEKMVYVLQILKKL